MLLHRFLWWHVYLLLKVYLWRPRIGPRCLQRKQFISWYVHIGIFSFIQSHANHFHYFIFASIWRILMDQRLQILMWILLFFNIELTRICLVGFVMHLKIRKEAWFYTFSDHARKSNISILLLIDFSRTSDIFRAFMINDHIDHIGIDLKPLLRILLHALLQAISILIL